MQIAKKAALLAATAGTLALLGTGTATANGYGGGSDRSSDVPTSVDISTFIFQKNDCDTRNGQAFSTGAVGPSGDIKIGSTCLNNIGG
ncbi:hypothetical protein [Streptomyces rapamycinicus]|uniref:Secreted protein n=2 Tax=Streptomyces rapamycinicus TaxID=1226757 RepID=A0A0A0NMR3_STRRN|nr:hypothetical protein [Streptomyces rapamycinicus]AGP60862.1 hypothetical protein M271_47500 [Streptomyces rapamycinicus NRRL 5491]MBB4787966.1 hypothetical protein [Streptomyces rapamycinicus]RLV72304.1 hypothetical protein D3C57_147295 [Streptomyces rapamycinicus NRRL 5491]UTP36401.1 hypothetical protein LIV37_48240 [Streptomyces rapamycinicus NRRL 5491]